jgi:isoleucyl-tRNA synthetase
MARHPEGQTMTVDYKSTIHLPRTDFPMKAGLPKREPEILARWDARRIRGSGKIHPA